MSLRALLDRLVRDGISPHAAAITEIASRGEISMVLLEPSLGWREALGLHGWNGEPVLAMTVRLGNALRCSDPVTESWVANPRANTTRIFAVIEDVSLLVNGDANGFDVEPGSTDDGTTS